MKRATCVGVLSLGAILLVVGCSKLVPTKDPAVTVNSNVTVALPAAPPMPVGVIVPAGKSGEELALERERVGLERERNDLEAAKVLLDARAVATQERQQDLNEANAVAEAQREAIRAVERKEREADRAAKQALQAVFDQQEAYKKKHNSYAGTLRDLGGISDCDSHSFRFAGGGKGWQCTAIPKDGAGHTITMDHKGSVAEKETVEYLPTFIPPPARTGGGKVSIGSVRETPTTVPSLYPGQFGQ